MAMRPIPVYTGVVERPDRDGGRDEGRDGGRDSELDPPGELE